MADFIPNEHSYIGFTPGPVGLMPAPSTVAAAAAAGEGSLATGTYKYKVTGVNDTGETAGSTEASVTTTSAGGVTVSWDALDGADSYRIYGRSTGEHLLTQVGDTTSWLDTGALVPGTETPPTVGVASNMAKPTVADILEAVDLTRYVTQADFGAQGNTVPTPNLKKLFENSIEGTSQGTGTLTAYRDDEVDTAFEVLPRRTRGYIILSRLTDTPAVAGAKVEVWPVRVSSRKNSSMQSNTPVTFDVTFAIPAEPAEDAVVQA